MKTGLSNMDTKTDSARRKDSVASELILVIVLLSEAVNYCLRVWETVLINRSDIANTLYISILIFVLFIGSFFLKKINFLKKDVILCVAFAMLCTFFSILRNGTWWLTFNNTILYFWGKAILSYMVIRCVKDWGCFLTIFAKASKIMIYISLITYILTLPYIPYRSTPEWYMFFSSAMVCPIYGTILNIFYNQKNLDRIAVVLMLVCVLINGARGSLVQIALFFILYCVTNKRMSKIIIIAVVIAMIAIFALPLLMSNQNFVALIGNSRTLSLMFSGNFSNDSGRASGYLLILQYFFSSPPEVILFGLGIGGDRFFISNYIPYFGAGYPHQFFIEILLHYGIIGAFIILTFIVYISIKAAKLSFMRSELADTIALLFTNVVVLMFSASYLTSSSMFLWVGFCVNICANKQHILKNKKDFEPISNKLYEQNN